MENTLIIEARKALKQLNNMHKRLTKRISKLKSYEGWNLKRESNRSPRHNYYDAVKPNSSKASYLGNESNPQVLDIKRYRYAKESLESLEINIKLLEDLINNYVPLDYASINSRLPSTYQTSITKTMTQAASSPTPRSAFFANAPEEALTWMRKMEAEKAKCPPYKPEQLKPPVIDQSKARSKSEVIIANTLLLSGIPFVYEVPMFVNGEMLLPDFRILSLIDLKTEIIIEHQGMIFDESYTDKFIHSLRLYLNTDWIPNKNLFFTFDDAKEVLNISQLISILRKFVDPTISIPDLEQLLSLVEVA